MKKTLLYGKAERAYPWSDGFSVKSDGTIDFKISGTNQLSFEDNEDITWNRLLYSELSSLATSEEILQTESDNFDRDPCFVYDAYISRLWNKLESYCNDKSPVEKAFLDLYMHICGNDFHQGALLPAMIPNVYINWDFSKEERGKTVKPYTVDFVLKSSTFGTNNLTIIEIDGLSHYADYDSSNRKYIVSEKRYADHLRKDRWLRSQGFNVFRIGNSEIEEITSLPKDKQDKAFYYFFRDIFGDRISIGHYDPGYYSR